MPDIFRVGRAGVVEAVATDPFRDEVNDLEGFLKKNPSLLGDGVRIFAEQVDTGLGDRLDLLAIDQASGAGQLLLIELKNVRADIRVLLQALRYATWVMSNPDSVRYLLSRNQIDAESVELKPTIIIVAPEIDTELVEMSRYVSGFQFSFIQIERFRQGDDHLVVVQRKLPERTQPPGVTVQEDWDWERYQKDLKVSPERIEAGKTFAGQLLAIIDKNGWNLEMRFRKLSCPFQLPGAWNVFALTLSGASGAGAGWNIVIKLPSPPTEFGLSLPEWANNPRWEEDYKQIRIALPSKEIDLSELEPVLTAAYEYVRQKAHI
ncbi:MAG TPA: hypothetical protein VNN21_05330 [Dehalococcoidia bacterium]|nr:hypothetical protein [Dehalococcoidia bacterium]